MDTFKLVPNAVYPPLADTTRALRSLRVESNGGSNGLITSPSPSGRTHVLTENPFFSHETLPARFTSVPARGAPTTPSSAQIEHASSSPITIRSIIPQSPGAGESITNGMVGMPPPPKFAIPATPSRSAAVKPPSSPYTSTKPFSLVGEDGHFVPVNQVFEPSVQAMDIEYPVQQRAPPAPVELGSVDVQQLTSEEVLFIFGVITIMANLTPRFTFKYGSMSNKKIGTKLTIYGHTVVLNPEFHTTYEARVSACSVALERIREHDPQWLSPPIPTGSPTTADWNWVSLLEAYTSQAGGNMPLYSPFPCGDQWLCNVQAQNRAFSFEIKSDSLGQAQNTAAHNSLFRLLISVDYPEIHAADTPDNITFRLQDAEKRKANPPPVPKLTRGRRKRKRALLEANHTQVKKGPVSRAAVVKASAKQATRSARRLVSAQPKPMMNGTNNANLVPVENSRLGPLEIMEIVEDPLKALKDLQTNLCSMPSDASYHSLMKKICESLKINVPEIRIEQDTSYCVAPTYMMQVFFDSSHPYLHRASPVTMGTFHREIISQERLQVSHALAIKKIIYYLINMVREDSQVDEKVFMDDALRPLSTMRREIHTDIQSQQAELD